MKKYQQTVQWICLFEHLFLVYSATPCIFNVAIVWSMVDLRVPMDLRSASVDFRTPNLRLSFNE